MLVIESDFFQKSGHFVKLLLPFVIMEGTRSDSGDRPSSPNLWLSDNIHSTASGVTVSTFHEENHMNQPSELSMEQQFNLSSFKMQVNQMSREQAQEFLVNLYEQMMVRENMYQHFLKYQWGLEPGPEQE